MLARRTHFLHGYGVHDLRHVLNLGRDHRQVVLHLPGVISPLVGIPHEQVQPEAEGVHAALHVAVGVVRVLGRFAEGAEVGEGVPAARHVVAGAGDAQDHVHGFLGETRVLQRLLRQDVRPAVQRWAQGYPVVQQSKDSLGQDPLEPLAEHDGLEVRDEVRLPHEEVEARRLLQSLDVRNGETNEQIHEDDCDENEKDEEYDVSRLRIQKLLVAIKQIVVLDLARHHDHRLYQPISVLPERLLVGEEHAETQRKGSEQARVRAQELGEILGDVREHVDIDPEQRKSADEREELRPRQEDDDGGQVVLPVPRVVADVRRNGDGERQDDDGPDEDVVPRGEVSPRGVDHLENLLQEQDPKTEPNDVQQTDHEGFVVQATIPSQEIIFLVLKRTLRLSSLLGLRGGVQVVARGCWEHHHDVARQ